MKQNLKIFFIMLLFALILKVCGDVQSQETTNEGNIEVTHHKNEDISKSSQSKSQKDYMFNAKIGSTFPAAEGNFPIFSITLGLRTSLFDYLIPRNVSLEFNKINWLMLRNSYTSCDYVKIKHCRNQKFLMTDVLVRTSFPHQFPISKLKLEQYFDVGIGHTLVWGKIKDLKNRTSKYGSSYSVFTNFGVRKEISVKDYIFEFAGELGLRFHFATSHITNERIIVPIPFINITAGISL